MRMTACLMAVVLVGTATTTTFGDIILPAVADAEVGERPGDDRGSNGTQLNTRFINNDRNELIALRFDLSGVDVNNFTDATLNMIHYRDGSTRPYVVYGVNDGAMGGDNNGSTPGYDDNTWNEADVVMSTMPGLIYDGDSTTQGINATDTTNLGGGNFSGAPKGSTEEISVSGLFSFLQSHPDDLVTLIVARDPSNLSTGQDRFASKEATELDGGSPTGSAGDFGPYLTLIPEPTSALLMMAGSLLGIGLYRRRLV